MLQKLAGPTQSSLLVGFAASRRAGVPAVDDASVRVTCCGAFVVEASVCADAAAAANNEQATTAIFRDFI